MGWTGTWAKHFKANGKIDIHAEVDALVGERLVKSVMVGSVCYCAIQDMDDSNSVYAMVVLTHTDNRGGEFYYKAISEQMGPAESKCPTSILKLLTPIDSEFANNWRERCWQYARRKKLPTAIGSQIEFNLNNVRWKLELMQSSHQFKTNWWKVVSKDGIVVDNQYFKKCDIPRDFVLAV